MLEQSIAEDIAWQDVGAAVIDFVADQGNFGAAVIDCFACLKKTKFEEGARIKTRLLGGQCHDLVVMID
jgi:hypothetical protein